MEATFHNIPLLPTYTYISSLVSGVQTENLIRNLI